MASARLPGKMLLPLGPWPVLAWSRRRLAPLGTVVLCCPESASDDLLADAWDGPVVRGPEADVLARILRALEAFPHPAVIIRATGDNPLVLPELAQLALGQREADGADYCSIEGSALGTTVEVLTRTALLRAHALADSAEEREHPTLGLLRRPEQFRITKIVAPAIYRAPDLRLTLDTPADYRWLTALIGAHPPPPEAWSWQRIRERAAALPQSPQPQHLLAEVQRLKEHAWHRLVR